MDKSSREGISVVICTYNGRSRISAAIDSVLTQEGLNDFDWELVVIDNCSTDHTYEYCMGYFHAHPLQAKCRVIAEKRPGAANARTRSLTEAKYSWILFVDDDNRLFPDYLSKGWKILNENLAIGVLGGRGIAEFEGDEPQWFSKYHLSFAVGAQASGNGKLDRNAKRKLYSAGSFFNKNILLKLYDSGFTPIMIGPNQKALTRGEDTEWCMLVELAGYSLWYSYQLKFYHYMPVSRMHWDYFVRLKQGIASGSACLQSYKPFYQKSYPGLLIFLSSYLLEYCKLASIKFKHSIVFWKKNPEADLGKKISHTKALAYRRDFNLSLRHFRKLQKLLNK